jgi:hypothetical protein
MANYIYSSGKCVFERLFFNNVLSKHTKQYLENVLNIFNMIILKVYWEEFKTIRGVFKDLYMNALNTKSYMKNNLENTIFQLFKNNEIKLKSEDLIYGLNTYVVETKDKEDIGCKICYNNKTTHILTHETHACTICESCINNFNLNTPCPFCRMNIENKLKLTIL